MIPKKIPKKDSEKVLPESENHGIIEPSKGTELYESISQYKQITSKRFRRSKEDLALGLTSEQAFNKRFNN